MNIHGKAHGVASYEDPQGPDTDTTPSDTTPSPPELAALEDLYATCMSALATKADVPADTLYGDWLSLPGGGYRHLRTGVTDAAPEFVARLLRNETRLAADYARAELYLSTPHRFRLPLAGRFGAVERRWAAPHVPPQASPVSSRSGDEPEVEELDWNPPEGRAGSAADVVCAPIAAVGDGAAACVLQGVLSPEECADVVAQARQCGLINMQESGYSARIRINDRAVIVSEGLADMLLHRALPHLTDYDIPDRGDPGAAAWPSGVPVTTTPGLWVVDHINPCFRVCRYGPGGFFACHYDGGHEMSPGLLSLKTFMVYLNTVPAAAGGATTFYTDAQKKYRKNADPAHAVHQYQPAAGDCLAFSSNLLHDGGVLDAGEKWILRSEVMYRYCGARTHGAPTQRPKSSREMAAHAAKR